MGRKSKHHISVSQYENPTQYFKEYYRKVTRDKIMAARLREEELERSCVE